MPLHIPPSTLHIPHFTLNSWHSTSAINTPHSTFRALHFAFYTLRFTLYTLHSALCTLHFTLHTLYFTIHSPHFTLHTLPFTLYSPHSTLYTPHSTLYTPHSNLTLYTLHFTLDTWHSTLYSWHFTLHTSHCTPDTPHSTLYTLHSTLRTLHFTLHSPHLHSTVHTLHFTLDTPHSTLYPLPSTLLFTLHTLHFTLHTPQFTLHSLHTTFATQHSTVYSHSTLCTPPHSTLHSLHWYGNRGRMYTNVEFFWLFGFGGSVAAAPWSRYKLKHTPFSTKCSANLLQGVYNYMLFRRKKQLYKMHAGKYVSRGTLAKFLPFCSVWLHNSTALLQFGLLSIHVWIWMIDPLNMSSKLIYDKCTKTLKPLVGFQPMRTNRRKNLKSGMCFGYLWGKWTMESSLKCLVSFLDTTFLGSKLHLYKMHVTHSFGKWYLLSKVALICWI